MYRVDTQIAAARRLCEAGIPLPAIEELDRAVKSAADAGDAEGLHRLAAELATIADVFPQFAGRAEAGANTARQRARALGMPSMHERLAPLPPPRDPVPVAVSAPAGPKPLRRRATLAQLTLFGVIVTAALSVLSNAAERTLLRDLETGFAGLAEAEASDQRQLVVGFVVAVSYVVAAVLFVAWFHRAYANLKLLGAGELRFGTGWAIGAWFVPILSLVRPKMIANDLWRASDPSLPASSAGLWARRSVPLLLAFWWLFFLADTALSEVAFQLSMAGDTIDELTTANSIAIGSDVVAIVGAVLAILVVRGITARQESRARTLPEHRI